MPVYDYVALNRKGKRVKGSLESESRAEAKEALREQGLMASKIEESQASATKNHLKGEKLSTFTIQLSQLVSAGIPLYESLLSLEEQYRGEAGHRIVLSLANQVKSGSSLSTAMMQFPGSFDNLYRSMISAGEAVGSLGIVLEKLSDLLVKQLKLKKQIVTSMIYPLILSVMCVLVISLLLGFVVPSIETIFEDRELSGITAFVINLSHFFRGYWWLYLPVIIFSASGLLYLFNSVKGKDFLERNLLKTPILKKVVLQSATARFTRTMGTLLEGGLTLVDALKVARGVLQNSTLEKEIKEIEEKIVEGGAMSSLIAQSRYFPPLLSKMILIGEETGNSAAMFQKLAEIYEDELEKNLSRLVAYSQPIILVVMGSIIFLIFLAILLPLTDMSAFG